MLNGHDSRKRKKQTESSELFNQTPSKGELLRAGSLWLHLQSNISVWKVKNDCPEWLDTWNTILGVRLDTNYHIQSGHKVARFFLKHHQVASSILFSFISLIFQTWLQSLFKTHFQFNGKRQDRRVIEALRRCPNCWRWRNYNAFLHISGRQINLRPECW